MDTSAAGAETHQDARGGWGRSFGILGPVIIIAGVAFALRGFISGSNISDSHPDVLSFWLPRFSFLGRSLGAGHIPLWNPYEMLGYRFAADPQSGWTYLAPMALFSTLSPGVAIRAFIALNPLLGGLSLYSFARLERLPAVAATVAGLSLAMMMAGSELAVSLPFAGTLAWTPVVLLGASGYLRTDTWTRRLAWLGLAGLGWSQVANAHLSHGLVTCTLLTISFLVVRLVADTRAGRLDARVALGRGALFLAFLPLAALAVLIPRLDFLQASSLQAGYDALGEPLAAQVEDAPILAHGVWAAWPLALGSAPGAYAGAIVLVAVPLAARARAQRSLVVAFAGALALTWASMLDVVIGTPWIRSALLAVPYGDVFLHNPGRLRFIAMVAIPVLGAAGIASLIERPLAPRVAAVWIGAGALLWLGLPLAAGGTPARFAFLGVALLVAVPVLLLLGIGRVRWAAATVTLALALELGAAAWYSQTYRGDTTTTGLEAGQRGNLIVQPLPAPDVDLDAFLAPTAFVDLIGDDPYLTWAPPAAFFEKGYLFAQEAEDWPGLTMSRGSLFGVRDVLGYNPVQMPRYWSYIRARTSLPVFYNASVIDLPTPRDADMMGVRWLIVPSGLEAPLPGTVVASADRFDLIEVGGWRPRAELFTSWRVLEGRDGALRAVLEDGFDPRTEVILESDPGLEPTGGGPRVARWSSPTPEEMTISTMSTVPSILVVRSSFDDGWKATVDGRPVETIPADSVSIGVPVEAGRHDVRLVYQDPAVTAGAFGGMLAWFALGVAWVVTWVRGHRQAPQRNRRSES